MRLTNLFTLGVFLLTTTAWAAATNQKAEHKIVRDLDAGLDKIDAASKEISEKFKKQLKQIQRCKAEKKAHGKYITEPCQRLAKDIDDEKETPRTRKPKAPKKAKEDPGSGGDTTPDPEGGGGADPEGGGGATPPAPKGSDVSN